MRKVNGLVVVGASAVAALGASGLGAAAPARAPAAPPAREGARTAFQLFPMSSSYLALNANRVWCLVNDGGGQCTQVPNSTVIGGAFWPKGTPDQYIFNGGLQIAAIIPDDGSSFAWKGDTVGNFFFDPRGFYQVSASLDGIYDSRSAEDRANWPSAAYVRDTTFFDASLIGRKAVSEQDSWVRYWDGAARGLGRAHTMGVLVDQRTLAWNRPDIGRDILFVLFRIINVTAGDRARYAGLAAAGYTPEDIDQIAKIGADYHARSDTGAVHLPDSGFAWTNLYVGFGQDPDVTSGGGSNYSTVVLPFATTVAYQADFSAPGWTYPVDVFRPPFAIAPGFTGTKVLRAGNGPVTGTSALTMFTNFSSGGVFWGPSSPPTLWRMLANHLIAVDGSCNAPVGMPLCYIPAVPTDTRWSLGTGPWPAVGGGQSVAFAIAYVFAAPLAAPLQSDGRGHLLGDAGFDLKPGVPATGRRLVAGTDTVRQIERVAGWTSFTDRNGNGDIEGAEVQVQPYSLLGKSAAAQVLADHKFVLSAPPAAPRFYVLPGDGQATIVWERSASELTGDPYYAVAADPLTPLYDPNFRRNDVEGYRVWRGRSLAALRLVAQFDYAGTTITDHTGQVFTDFARRDCAPELGLVTGCGADFLHGGAVSVPLSGPVVQVPPGARTLLASGGALVLRADTVLVGGASGLPPLRDTGVPFSYVDSGLVDGTTYVYAVTAFDVNSINAGPTSLESEIVGKTVTPRAASSNLQLAQVEIRLEGGDGSRLDPSAPFPTIDPNDGTFAGPIPPANGATLTLPAVVQELLPAGTFTLVVDSVGPGFADGSVGAAYPLVYFSVLGGPASTRGATSIVSAEILSPPGHLYEYVGPLVPYDPAQARRFGVGFATDARMAARFSGLAPGLETTSPGVAQAAWYDGRVNSASRYLAHSRWFDEGGREPPDPTITPFASASHTNGALTGVTAIFSPIARRLPSNAGSPQRIPSGYGTLARASLAAWHPADFVLRWGSGGQVTVTDLTHSVPVPYKRAIQPGYGFLNASALVAAGVTSAQLNDGTSGVVFDPSVASYYSLRTTVPVCTSWLGAPCVPLSESAQLQPTDVNDDGVSDGTGVALVLDGEPFFFLMGALPAAGTAWHLRAVGGAGMTATCRPALPLGWDDLLPASAPTDCSGYAFTPPPTRPAYVPGLRYTVAVTRQFGPDTAAYGGLARVHTVPDPFYATNGQGGVLPPSIRFVNLPERAIIRIYTVSGILVTVLTHNDPTAGGEEVWDVTNRGGRHVASGVYFYHVETPDHQTRVGRLTVLQPVWP